MEVDRDKHWKRRPFSGVPAARKSKGPINMAMVEGVITPRPYLQRLS
jgi:hypothetical protein